MSVEAPAPPVEQVSPPHNFFERAVLKYVDWCTDEMPRQFDGEQLDPVGQTIVYGSSNGRETNLYLTESDRVLGEETTVQTNIHIERATTDPFCITALRVAQQVSESTGELQGIGAPWRKYEMGSKDNSLTLLAAALCIRRAVHTIDRVYK